MSTSQSQEIPYGKRVLPSLIDQIAKEDPNRLYISYPTGQDFSAPVRDVTFADFARAIDRAAGWIEEKLGKGENFQTIAWIGPQDIRYYFIALGAIKVGYKALLPSPRNSVSHHLHVLNKTDCNIILRDPETNLDHIKAEKEFQDITAPGLEWFLEETEVKHYPYTKTYEEAKNDPAVVLHSSGSTGPPKPIVLTQGSLCTVDAHHYLDHHSEYVPLTLSVDAGSKMYVPFPLFHAAGLLGILGFPIFYERPAVLAPLGPVKSTTVYNALDNLKLDGIMIAPSLLEEMVHDEKSLSKLDGLKAIWYGGGPCTVEVGEAIRKHAPIFSVIGTTESLAFPAYSRHPEDWNYINYGTTYNGIQFRDNGNDLYEMVFVRDPKTDQFHSTWFTFPDLQEYSTKDLYSKHPTRPGHWMHQGRSDDVLVLSNGEKVVPGPLQDAIKASPEVRDALVLGHSRFEVAALIELEDSAQQLSRHEILNKLAPYIKHANETVPKFARLSKDRIIFTTPEKPMVRAAKGTVIRKPTLAAYEQEIEDTYAGSTEYHAAKFPLIKNQGKDDTVHALIDIITQVSDIQNVTKDQDIFVSGFDSLGVMNVVRLIKAQLKAEDANVAQDNVTASLVYANPTIDQLADAVRALANKPNDPETQEKGRLQAIEDMLAKYSQDLPSPPSEKPAPKSSNLVVILTGSTGSLGSYLLDSLLKSSSVSHIYALNRADDGFTKQVKQSRSRQLSTDFHGKVTFLHADLSNPLLGLHQEEYQEIKDSADIIIHNQWQVDFNLSLPSFGPHIAGVRNLIDFSVSAPNQPYIIFTSSVSTIGNWAALHPDSPDAPEVPIEDSRVPVPIGYGESKQIGERLLQLAAQNSRARTAIARVGQVAGPVEKVGGVWNKQEWFPSIIASSAYLKLLPSSVSSGNDTSIDWIPVDILADVLVQVSLHDVSSASALPHEQAIVYNLANFQSTPWSLVPTVLKYLPPDTQVVPLADWVAALAKSAEQEHPDTLRNPGIKLLDFYQSMVGENNAASAGGESGSVGRMLIKNARERSAAMQSLRPVGPEWIESWMLAWGFSSSNA
jgi:thioester reductase-like protein/acyl-CoA synthetase (AMP-forming)/AMP-acid ligase II